MDCVGCDVEFVGDFLVSQVVLGQLQSLFFVIFGFLEVFGLFGFVVVFLDVILLCLEVGFMFCLFFWWDDGLQFGDQFGFVYYQFVEYVLQGFCFEVVVWVYLYVVLFVFFVFGGMKCMFEY